jgi:hypothetical protein
MPYILNKTNGSVVATVADGSINQTTDLTFVGKNFAGYGEIINENLLKLLENFSNRTAPAKAILGQLWFDSSTNRLKVRKGNFWNAFPYVEYSNTQPKTLIDGDLWFNSSNNKLYVKNSADLSGFTLIGPSVSGSGSNNSSIVTVSTVTDTDDTKQTVFTHTVNNEVVMVVSAESFNVKSTDPLYSTFKTIKKGITLSNADSSTGVSSPSGNFFYGTAAHALRLGNYTDDDFLLKSYFDESINASSGFNVPTDDGLLVGVNNVFKFHADSGQQEGKISAVAGTQISFNLRYPTASDPITNILTISGNKILPGSSVSVDLGANVNGNRFSNIYVDTVNSTNVSTGRIIATTATFTSVNSNQISGSLQGNVIGNVTGNVIASAVTATNIYGTVNGNIRTSVITVPNDSDSGMNTGSINGTWSLSGSLSISSLPTFNSHATNKQYVDSRFKGFISFNPTNGDVFDSRKLYITRNGIGVYTIFLDSTIQSGNSNYAAIVGSIDSGLYSAGNTSPGSMDVYTVGLGSYTTSSFVVRAIRRYNSSIIQAGGNDNNSIHTWAGEGIDPLRITVAVF